MNRRKKLRTLTAERPNYATMYLESLEDRQLLSTVNWTVDSAASTATVTLPDQNITLSGISATVRIRNNDNSAWTVGNSAHMSGTIATDYTDGSSIQFL